MTSPLLPSLRRHVAWLLLALAFLMNASLTEPVQAQGQYNLPTNILSNNGAYGITFNLTANRPVRIYRFWNNFYSTGTFNLEIWAHPNGGGAGTTAPANDGLWQYLGSAQVTATSTAGYIEIPLTLNFVMQQGQTWGFMIWAGTSLTFGYRTGVAPYVFSDTYLSLNTEGYGISGGSTSATAGTTNLTFANYPRQFCGIVYYDENITGPNDAGISAITSPKDFCTGTLPVKVTLQNYGTNALTSAIINWSMNGVTQTPVPWTGFLDTLNATTRQTEVTLGTRSFVFGTPYTIKAWTTMPNGVADTVNRNDSTTAVRSPALSGIMTIGGTSPNYATFTDAINALNNYGVCGPVVFNVRTGTYTEQVQINQISGASSTNTITFQSETGANTDVTLTYSANSTLYHTMMLNSTNWLRVRNMTIIGSNVSYGRVVTLQGSASNNIFDNNRIIALGTTSSTCSPIYQYMGSTQYNTFSNNFIQGGYYCIYWYSSGTYQTQNRFVNNKVLDFYYYGVYSYYQDSFVFTGNTIQTSVANTNYMFYGYYYSGPFNVSNNKIISLNSGSYTKYGLMMYYAQAAVGNEGLISNNFISINGSTTAYGMYLYYPYNVNVEFNTVNNRQTTASGYTLYLYYGQNVRYMNNIIYNNTTGYLTYFYTTTWRGFDYNVYYTPYTTFGYWNGTTYANLAAWQTISASESHSLWKAPNFVDITTGDLHLTGASRNDMTLTGVNESYITADIDGDPRIIPYRGADEACYILPGTVNYSFTDVSGNPVSYVRQGDAVYAKLNVSFPTFDINLTVTVNFYTVPGNQLAYTYTFNAAKLNGVPLNAQYMVPVPANLASGYYRIDGILNTRNSCGDYIDYRPGDRSLLVVSPGADPCIVWPGDVNSDGVVNYGDRTSLNKYIFNANLRPTWLQGPARYRADFATNPLTYYTWEGQASAPWFTPEGCYMDADGNGVVNAYDQIAIKVNFMKTHGLTTPKQGDGLSASSFDLGQNYPNPFNPSTKLEFAVPERSKVRLVVTDIVGRDVAVIVDDAVAAGVHSAVFNATNLQSGTYVATVTMTGLESGLTFTKSIKMTLSK